MIDTVLKEVREAEEKAELMQKQAYQRGKDIVLKAEAEAEAQKKSTVRDYPYLRRRASARRSALSPFSTKARRTQTFLRMKRTPQWRTARIRWLKYCLKNILTDSVRLK